ncbi:MAG: translocation/assembly module TamB domain-containing protein [Myxococcota bacterium]
MRWIYRLVSWFLGWPALAVFSLIASVLFHLDTNLGRELGRDILNDFVSETMDGRMQAGYITQLRLWRTIVKDTFVYDPDGTPIIYGETVELGIDPIAGLRGKLRFYYADLTNGWVRLIDNGEGEPTFLDAFEPADKSPTVGEPFHAIVDDMDIKNVEVFGEILDLENLRVLDLHTRGRMEFYYVTEIEIWSGDGRVVSPFPFEGQLNNVVGTVYTDTRGTQVLAELSRGREHMSAEIVYRPPAGGTYDDPFDLDLYVRVDPVSSNTLREVGFGWAESLRGDATGWVRLWGSESDYRLQADITTDGGKARIKGELPDVGTTKIEITSKSARLAKVINGAPDVDANGTIKFDINDKNPDVFGVEIESQGFRYEEIQIPPFVAKGRVRPDGIDVESVETQYAGGELFLSGHVEYTGVSEIQARGSIPDVSADPNFVEWAPGIRGGAKFDLEIMTTMAGDFQTSGWVSFTNFDYGALDAKSLRLEGVVSGDPKRPKVDATLLGTEIRVAGYPIGQGEAIVRGGPDQYVANGSFAAPGARKAEFQARVEASDGLYRLDVDTIELAVGDLSWRGSVNNLVLDPVNGVTFDRVLIGRGEQRLEADGEWLFNGPDDIQADLQNFDLAVLKILYPESAPNFTGRVDLHFEFRGDLDKQPTIVAEGTLTNANLWDVTPVNAAYLIHYDASRVDADAQVDMGGRGNFTLSTSGLVDPEAPNVRTALRGGVYEMTLSTGAMDLTLLELVLEEDMPDITGFADASIKLSGSFDAPSFEGEIEVPALKVRNWVAVEFRSTFRYEYGALLAQVSFADDKGPLFDSEGSLLVDLVNLVENPSQAIETFETSPWRLSMRVPPRKLSDLPDILGRDLVPDPDRLQLSASLTLAGGAFQTRGDFYGSFDWQSESSEGLCGGDANPRLTMRASLENDVTEVGMDGVVADAQVLRVDASAPTPLDEWLRAAKVPEIPVMQLSADLYDAPTEDIPYVCQYAAGEVQGRLRATNLFGDDPTLSLAIDTDELRARRLEPGRGSVLVNTIVETPPARSNVSADYADGVAKVGVSMNWWNGGGTNIQATAPVVWDREHMVPELADRGQVEGRADFDRMPLQAVLAWMAGVVNVQGILQGSVTAQGTVQQPNFVGSVELTDGRVDLRNVGQTLENVTGRAIFDEDGIAITDVTATDAKGSANANGRVVLDGLRPAELDVEVDTKSFPVREEGSIMARLNGDARLRAKFEEDALDGEVRLRKLTLDIPESSATPQDLAPHPEVYFIGEDYTPVVRTDPYRISLQIISDDNVIIRSKDQGFLVEASTNLDTTLEEELLVKGNVNLRGGNFQVFGKRFELRSGSMVFDGDPDMDAKVDLVARHQLRGSSDSVTVTVSGRLSDPTIEFTSTAATTSEAQVIALLVTGTTRQQRGLAATTEAANAETTDFLSGVAAGLFSASLQSQFGGLAPTFGVQTGQGFDETAADTTVQVGFNVDSILPDNVPIRGLYVEGQFVARRNEGGPNSTGQAQRPGFLVEALWPLSFVTTATFAPPSNWSIDVTWEP